ncbi:MAG TPA: hypothetical protein VMB85_10295 [Bryobacteraceae bacterium]|nr:hypothetical protein [Bryobacteraceae bacterium]
MQHAQQTRLKCGTGRGEFIEKQRAALGRFKQARMIALGSREGAARMAEKLGFEQCFGHARAIHGQKWPALALAEIVNRARDQFFARSRFARNQNGGITARRLSDKFVDLRHRRAATNQTGAGKIRGVLIVRFRFGDFLAGIDVSAQQGYHRADLKRFTDKITRSAGHCIHGRLKRRFCCHQDDRQIWI